MPLLGFGAWPLTSISTGQPVIGAPVNKSVLVDVPVKKSILALFLTTTDGKKTSVFVAFGVEGSNASALVALSDVSAGGVVERRLLRGWSFQQTGFAGHFARASCLVIHSGDARTSGVMSASAITSGAALPNMGADYRGH